MIWTILQFWWIGWWVVGCMTVLFLTRLTSLGDYVSIVGGELVMDTGVRRVVCFFSEVSFMPDGNLVRCSSAHHLCVFLHERINYWNVQLFHLGIRSWKTNSVACGARCSRWRSRSTYGYFFCCTHVSCNKIFSRGGLPVSCNWSAQSFLLLIFFWLNWKCKL